MQVRIGKCTLELIQGDITDQDADAVVNAANPQLAGGGGVDGAIHRAAGPTVMQETREKYPDGCPVGSAVVTGAGNLKAKLIFHTVGPVWQDGAHGEPYALQSAYRTCMQLAVKHECSSIAFPAISTGVYGYPTEPAANVALKTTTDFMKWHKQPGDVRFVLFDSAAFDVFSRSLSAMVN